MIVIGTRPEAIKMAPVIRALQDRKAIFQPVVCATGQHRQMLDQVIKLFGFPVDYDLDIMTPDQTLASVTARAIEGLSEVINTVVPAVILVQGDTTTAMCGALAGYYQRIPVGHVEAGLRTNDKYAPFPEEINRRIIGQVADFHFAPTERARQALENENCTGEILVTGNTVIDALLWMRRKVKKQLPDLPEGLPGKIQGKVVILVTGHRRESFGKGFENICYAIRETADEFEDVVFVYPVHLNPNVREPVRRILGKHPRVVLLEPMSYEPFVWLMDKADIVLTDSGGVQEEAPSLGKPVLVMRTTTERPEGIDAGNAILVGADQKRIKQELTRLITDPVARHQMGAYANPYGDGKASKRIVAFLEKKFCTGR